MGDGDDFFWTGGGFSDWSGTSAGPATGNSSAGNFSSGSSSCGGSSGGGGGNNKPGPNDWKRICCGCLIIVIISIVVICVTCWDKIYYRWFYTPEEEVITEQCDTIAIINDDAYIIK